MNIREVIFGGNDENRAVVIIARRTVLGNKTVEMKTPALRFDDEAYSYSADLKESVEVFMDAVWQYFFKRKFAQLEIPSGAEDAPLAEVIEVGDNIKAQIEEHKAEIEEDKS